MDETFIGILDPGFCSLCVTNFTEYYTVERASRFSLFSSLSLLYALLPFSFLVSLVSIFLSGEYSD